MEEHGDTARETTSVLSTKLLQTVRSNAAGPYTFVGTGSIANNWADVCGFLELPDSDRYWMVRMHGASSIPRKTLGLRPTDQSCHHETWLHLDFVDWREGQSQREKYNQRIFLK